MHAADNGVNVVDTDSRAYLFPIPAGAERSVRSEERDFPVERHARGDRRHVLLGDTALNEAVGKRLLEMVRLRGFSEVGGQYDDAQIGRARFDDALAKSLACTSQSGVVKNIRGELRIGVYHTSNSLRPMDWSNFLSTAVPSTVMNISSVTATNASLICAPMHSRVGSQRDSTACAWMNGFPSTKATLPCIEATSKTPGSSRKKYSLFARS